MEEEIKKKISCGIYLFRNDNKFLIEHPTGHRPNIWTIPKGRPDEGEIDYFMVAKRELLEETGIDLNKYKIIKTEELDLVRYGETNKHLKGFFVKVDSNFSDIELKCDSMVYRNGVPSFPEVDKYQWVTIGESMSLLYHFQLKNLTRCDELISERMKHLTTFVKF
jgi:8-oxo-dGTP pyrophosphatase MutT (NUDIX family)